MRYHASTQQRREYVEAECEQAGLTPEQTELAVSAAMSVGVNELSDDDFEQMVEHCIQGAAEAEEPDVIIPVSKLPRF